MNNLDQDEERFIVIYVDNELASAKKCLTDVLYDCFAAMHDIAQSPDDYRVYHYIKKLLLDGREFN